MDRTLSVLQSGRLEACEKEFAGLGGPGLFDPETTDLDAERLFAESYYAQEEKEPRLHRIEELRVKVLGSFPAEMCMLTEDELHLMIRMVFLGGETPLRDGEELYAAVSLIRRMWCRAVPEKGDWLRLPRQLIAVAMLMLASDEMDKTRERKEEILDKVDNTLYLAGMLPAEMAQKDMAFQLQDTLGAVPSLCLRLLKASFDTAVDREGRLMLVHPGLADPRSLAEPGAQRQGGWMDPRSLTELYDSLMDVEDPLYERMISLIRDVCRQEVNPETAVEELILLAKQGAPAEELRKVLSSRLICLPTEEMTAVLRELHDRIPGWRSLNMERVQ